MTVETARILTGSVLRILQAGDGYMEFVAAHGGQTNAVTAGEYTNYFFDIENTLEQPSYSTIDARAAWANDRWGVALIGENLIRLTIHEGRNRQIRRRFPKIDVGGCFRTVRQLSIVEHVQVHFQDLTLVVELCQLLGQTGLVNLAIDGLIRAPFRPQKEIPRQLHGYGAGS